MAQTGYTPIQLYYSTTAAAVPLADNLNNGELGINITDGKLYYKNNGGTVTLLASTAGASGDVVGPASATANALARFDSTTGKLIKNSVGILSDAGVLTGLTGLTSSGSITLSSLTSGRVPYASTGGLLTDSANLTFNGTTLTVNDLTDSSLTAGRVTFAGTAGNLTDSANLFWDNTNARLGIGTSSPALKLQISSSTTDDGLRIQNTSAANTTAKTTRIVFYGTDTGSTPKEAADIYTLPENANYINTALTFHTRRDDVVAEKMRLDSQGNLGLGVVPNPLWGNGRSAIDMGTNAYVGGTALSHLTNNVYFNGANFIYKTTAATGMYQIAGAAHQWYSAASGTAGNAITFTQAMTLDASGNFLVGATSVAALEGYRFYKNYGRYDNGTFVGFLGGGTALGSTAASDFYLRSENALAFGAGGLEKFRIASTGAFGLSGANYGTSGQVLTSGGSGAAPTWTTVSAGSAAGSDTQIQYNNSTAFGAASSFTFNKSTTAPQLNLVGTTSSNFQLRATTATNGPYVGLSLANADAALYWTWDTIGAIPLRFVAAGVEQMRINGTGQVGIGTGAPATSGVNSGLLQVIKPAFVDTSSVAYAISVNGGGGGAGNSGTQTGGIKIKIDPPNYITTYGLYVDQTAGGTGQSKYAGYFLSTSGQSSVSSYGIYSEMNASTDAGLYATNFSIYSFANGGGANSTAWSYWAKTANNAQAYGMLIEDTYSTSATKNAIVFNRSGTNVGFITTTLSATAYNTSSDYRLKENVQVIQNALDDVMRMRPVTYDWIGKGEQGIGFIAHELQEILPQAVQGTKDATKFVTKTDENNKMIVNEDGSPKLFEEPVYQGVDTSFVVPHLVKAIQELKAEFDAYKAAHP